MKKILFALMLTSAAPFAFSSNNISSHMTRKADPITAIPKAVLNNFNDRFAASFNLTWKVTSTPSMIIYVADFYVAKGTASVTHVQAAFSADGKFLGKTIVEPSRTF